MKTKNKAEIALLSTALIWGGTFALIKSALSDVSPTLFITLRFSVATFVLYPFFRKYFSGLTLRNYKQATLLGVLLFAGFITQTLGLQFTSATKSAFITGTFVVFTPLFQTLLEKRIPAMQNMVGIVFVFVGIVLLSSRGASGFEILSELETTFNFGDFLTLLCAVFYALYIVYLDIISNSNEPKFLTFFQIFVTALLSIVSVSIFGFTGIESASISFTPTLIFAVIYTSIFATILTTFLQTKFQKEVTPTKASILFSMEPIFAAVFAFLLINEKLSMFGIIGSLFIFAGVLISELWRRLK